MKDNNGLLLVLGGGLLLWMMSKKNKTVAEAIATGAEPPTTPADEWQLTTNEKRTALEHYMKAAFNSDQRGPEYAAQVIPLYIDMLTKMTPQEIDVFFTVFFDYNRKGKYLGEDDPLYAKMEILKIRYPILKG